MKSYVDASQYGGLMKMSKWVKLASLVVICPLAVLQSGCQPRETKWKAQEAFKTQIIVSTSTGSEFKQVELYGVENKGTLAGRVVDFFYSPTDKDGVLIGNKPLARFIDDHGVFIPADQISLQMVTLYYHLQQLKNLELTALNSSASILKWPRKVALAVKVINAPDMKYDNAFYNHETDALFFVPYKDQAFPLALNQGVIGHEHFHSYFSYQVLNPLMEQNKIPNNFNSQNSVTDIYNLFVLKIINEGLADVWGWIYSNDPDFVAVSLPKVEKTRNLEKGTDTFLSRVQSKSYLNAKANWIATHCAGLESKCVSDESYRYGTLLARGFKSFTMARRQTLGVSDQEARKLLASAILNLNIEIQKIVASHEAIDLDKVILLLKDQFNSLSVSECQVLQNMASSSGVVKCD